MAQMWPLCVQDHYQFVYKVIDKHVSRIESSPCTAAVHHDSSTLPAESPSTASTSPRSTPCRPGAPTAYWHTWVSCDELPCRDVAKQRSSSSPPCTPRDRSLPPRRTSPGDGSVRPRPRQPCGQKRKFPCIGGTGDSKKQKRESLVTEQSPAQPAGGRRSVSPCYRLPKPSFDETRRSAAGHMTRPCKPKPSAESYAYKRRPCRQRRDTTDVPPQASLYSKVPCPGKTSTPVPPRDLMTKPCSQQTQSRSVTEERPYELIAPALPRYEPCRQLMPAEATPQTTMSEEGKPHSRCAQRELLKVTERSDFPKEVPCKQIQQQLTTSEAKPCKQVTEVKDTPQSAVLERKPYSKCAQAEASKTTQKIDLPKEIPCKQMTKISEIQQPFAGSGRRPCKQAKEVKETPQTAVLEEKRQSKCAQKELPKPTERSHLPKEIPCKQKTIASDIQQSRATKPCKQTTEVKETPQTALLEEKPRSKCAQRGLPKPTERSDLPKEVPCKQKQISAEIHRSRETKPCRQTTEIAKQRFTGGDQVSARKPCDKLDKPRTVKTTVSKERKPCTQNDVENILPNRKRCPGRRKYEDKSSKKDSAVTSDLKGEPTVLKKQKDCKQKAVLENAQQEPLPVETTKKPCECKDSKADDHLTTTAQTDAQMNLVPKHHMTKHPSSVIKEKPCKKKAVESDSKIKDTITTDNAEMEQGNEKHQPVFTKKKACKEKKMQQDFPQETFAEIDAGITQSLKVEDVNKHKPCRPKAEAKVATPSDQAAVHGKKRCKDKPAVVESAPQNAGAETAIVSTDNEGDERQLNTEQEVEEQHYRCSADITDNVIAWMSRSSLLLDGPNETSTSKQRFRAPCDSIASKAVMQEIQYEGETSEAEEEELQSCTSHSLASEPNRCGCPDAEKSKTSLEEKQQGMPEMKSAQTKVAQPPRTEEKVTDVDKLASTVQDVSTSRCQQMPPCQTDDPPQNMAADEQPAGRKSPCPKPTSDQSMVSASRLVSRCKQARVLKLFKYKKKLPCKSTPLADSSESLQSGGSGLSPYPSTQLSDSRPLAPDPTEGVEKLADGLKGADLNNNDDTGTAADSVQSFVTNTDEGQMRKVQSDDHDVVTRRQNLSNEAVMHNSEPSMDVLDSRATENTEDDNETMKRKDSGMLPQRPSSKPLSVPGTVAEDSSDNNSLEVESNFYEIGRKKRRDSGVLPERASLAPSVPGTVAEDIPALPEWNSSDNNSSEVESKVNVPKKLYSIKEHQSRAVTVITKDREDSKMTTKEHSARTKAPDKDEDRYYENESDNWDSTDELESDTLRPKVTSYVPVAVKSCRDADDKDCNNSGSGIASDELADSDWSADSSSHRESGKPQSNMSGNNSTGNRYSVHNLMPRQA